MTTTWGGIIPGAPLAIAPPLHAVPVVKIHNEYNHHPQYTYGYKVHDAITGDAKSQHETRNGDVVSGSYSLIEADGTRRVVEYTADPINGFNAVVHREPAILHAVPAVPAVPAVAAPVIPPIRPVVYPAFAKFAPGFPSHLGHHY
ncbi:hypothetical protein PV327_008578 [Microctonus hyperodae]|uniref:Uncharacterized protein n=1 Tax=Microctonus hyperodae TaxID=165561 RepID=A0AA39F3F3_MICHY|nr:hypothetical protein PV327_008578 [Microctonus hyperodae]